MQPYPGPFNKGLYVQVPASFKLMINRTSITKIPAIFHQHLSTPWLSQRCTIYLYKSVMKIYFYKSVMKVEQILILEYIIL